MHGRCCQFLTRVAGGQSCKNPSSESAWKRQCMSKVMNAKVRILNVSVRELMYAKARVTSNVWRPVTYEQHVRGVCAHIRVRPDLDTGALGDGDFDPFLWTWNRSISSLDKQHVSGVDSLWPKLPKKPFHTGHNAMIESGQRQSSAVVQSRCVQKKKKKKKKKRKKAQTNKNNRGCRSQNAAVCKSENLPLPPKCDISVWL